MPHFVNTEESSGKPVRERIIERQTLSQDWSHTTYAHLSFALCCAYHAHVNSLNHTSDAVLTCCFD